MHERPPGNLRRSFTKKSAKMHEVFKIEAHERLRAERSTPVTSEPVEVRFSFLLGYDVFLAVTAEVTTETDFAALNHGYDVTILECVEENGNGELKPYGKGCEWLRAALEEKAIECSHNSKYHVH